MKRITQKEPTKFRIQEIFYSVQGEGYLVGTPAVFIRFAGCNLQCPFCDEWRPHSETKEYTAEGLQKEVERIEEEYNVRRKPMIVLTGGEPTIQIPRDSFASLELFKALSGYFVSMETNGTHPIPEWVQWVAISPKKPGEYPRASEYKVLMNSDGNFYCDGKIIPSLSDFHLDPKVPTVIQPIVYEDEELTKKAQKAVLNYVLQNPKFTFGSRLHLTLGVR